MSKKAITTLLMIATIILSCAHSSKMPSWQGRWHSPMDKDCSIPGDPCVCTKATSFKKFDETYIGGCLMWRTNKSQSLYDILNQRIQ